jgi:hypothetical protein
MFLDTFGFQIDMYFTKTYIQKSAMHYLFLYLTSSFNFFLPSSMCGTTTYSLCCREKEVRELEQTRADCFKRLFSLIDQQAQEKDLSLVEQQVAVKRRLQDIDSKISNKKFKLSKF